MIEQYSRVGVIGLGTMGMGVARSLLRAGLEVHVCDIRPETVSEVVQAGGHGHATPAALAPHAEALILLVVNAAQVDTVLFGEEGAAAAMKPGSVVVSSVTLPPDFAEALAGRLAEYKLLLIDAPVSGGGAKAALGEMSVMASGPEEAFAPCETLFSAIASKLYRLGDRAGQGSTVKMLNQLLAGVHIAAAAEAMAFGIRVGADPATVYEVISNSAGSSWMFQNRVPHILADDYTPLSAVNIFVKDLGIALDSAKKSVFPLPLSATAHQMFMQASAAGFGLEDDAAVIKIFPGIELPTAKSSSVKRASGQ